MISFLRKISEEGILLELVENNLELFSEKETVDSELLSEIKDRKEEIVQYLKNKNQGSISNETHQEIPNIPIAKDYDISTAQNRMWILSQFEEASLAYSIPDSVELKDLENYELFVNAINSVVERHEILRTVFIQGDNGTIRQKILKPAAMDFKVNHLDFRQKNNKAELVDQYIKNDCSIGFDLEKGPLLRATMLQIDDKDFIFYYNMHHIISDGWSVEVLTNDVFEFYQSYLKGVSPNLVDLKIQYKDYAAWQQHSLNSKGFENSKEYWLNKFSGSLPALNFINQKTRPKIKSYNGKMLATSLSTETTKKLKAFSLAQNGSLFISLISVLDVLFHHYTGSDDIIIGFPVAGRNHISLENQIGCYLNTVAIRNQVDPTKTFREFYQKVKQNSLEAYNHEMYPFERIVDDLDLERDLSRSPVFDVMMVLENEVEGPTNKVDEQYFGDIKDCGVAYPKYDFVISFIERKSFVSLEVIFNTDIYHQETVENLISHFKNLCNNLIDNDTKKIGEVEYVNPKEKEKIIVEYNHTTESFPKNKTLHGLLADQVHRTPNNTAIQYLDEEISYTELQHLVNRLSNHLVKIGNFKGKPIPIVSHKSPSQIWGVLGILNVGAHYVPVKGSLPFARIEEILNQTEAEVVLIDPEYLPMFEGMTGINKVILSEATFSKEQNTFEPLNIKDTELGYIIFTSGSTGKPKGVVIDHRGAVNTVHDMNNRFQVTENDIIFGISDLNFDLSVYDIFGTFACGATLVLPAEKERQDPAIWLDYVKSKKITLWNSVPQIVSLLVEECEHHGNSADLESLRLVWMSGDWIPVSLPDRIKNLNSSTKIISLGGATEASIWSINFPINEVKKEWSSIPYGMPLANQEMYVLNDYLAVCPENVLGNIFIGGIGLAKGYYKDKIKTDNSFIFHEGFNKMLYKTGDLGYFHKDGYIVFMGRNDGQVKVRGFRVELGEIEHHLKTAPEIKEAIVIAKKLQENENELIAYLITDKELDLTALRNYMFEKLPDYMVPSYFIPITEFPLSANGKLDRKALPDPETKNETVAETFEAPKTEREKVLSEVWADVLNKEKVGNKDNFYHLGGDSIKSIQVVSRLKQLGFTLTVDQILRNPVLKDLAQLIEFGSKSVDQSEVSGDVPLTPVQHYFFEKKAIQKFDHFNQSVVLQSKGKVDEKILKECIDGLIRHHDALRMSYVDKDAAGWTQNNNQFTNNQYQYNFYDLSGATQPEKEMEKIGQTLQQGFDYENGPLVRVGHFRLKGGDRIGLIVHHLVIDGVSWRILLEDLLTLYTQLTNGVAQKLPLKTNSFQEWATKLNNFSNDEKLQSELSYWETICNLSTKHSIAKKAADKSEVVLNKEVNFRLDKDQTRSLLTSINSVYNTEVQDILLASLGLSIKKVFGIEKTILKMEGHGREEIINDIDISRTVGWFTSIYPFMLDTTGRIDLHETLIDVKESIRKIPNKGVGFGILKYLSNATENLEFKPSVVFNYLGDFGNSVGNKEEAPFEFAAETVGENLAKENQDNELLNVNGMIVNGQLNISIDFSDVIFEAKQMETLCQSFQTIITKFINTLNAETKVYKTPSDLSYNLLSVEALGEINKKNKSESINDAYQLSPLQQGLYYHWITNPSNSLYCIQTAYRVTAKGIEVDNLKEAFHQLVNRHAALKTSFINVDEELILQVVGSSVDSNFTYKKLPKGLSPNEIDEALETYKIEDQNEGFDLETPSQIRLKIIEISEGDYTFIWSHHHIIMDGWCISILINDFYQLLNGIVGGYQVALEEPVPFANYIKWLDTIDTEDSISFWRDYLNEYSDTAVIPFKNKNESSETYDLEIEKLEIDGTLNEQLKQFFNSNGITLNSFIQGAWGYLLSKYNDIDDVVFGAVVSGRPPHLNGVEDMVGLFINTIPVRVKVDKDDTPVDLFAKVHKHSIDSNNHHYLSLSVIQSLNDLGRSLIEHILIFENYPVQEVIKEDIGRTNSDSGDNDLSIESIDVFEQTNYDFNIAVTPTDASIEIEFRYNANCYDKKVIETIKQQFQQLIQNLIQNPNQALKDISIAPADYKNQVLNNFNNTKTTYQNSKTMVDLFEDQVKLNPNKKAIISNDQTLTYNELNDYSTQFALYLQETYQIEKDDLIGIMLPRNCWLIAAMLGIIKSGGAYVPIDPMYPEQRKNYIKEDSKYKILVDENELNKFQKIAKNFEDRELITPITPEDLLYTIYTSGSTGQPKGVMLEHRNIVAFLDQLDVQLGYKHLDIMAATTNVTFDISVLEIFGAICSGRQLIVFDELDFDPAQFISKMNQHQVEILQLTPSRLLQVEELLYNNSVASLKTLLVGGEAFPDKVFRKKETISNLHIVNVYGPTETTIWSSALNLLESDNLTIGTALNNEQLYIMNEKAELQAIGIPGEICIGGTGVARGYWNKAELTTTKFITHEESDYGRIYRTGDLGRWLPNGEIEFLGRNDDQVKIRGHRIELGEIESVIADFDSHIKQVVVIVRSNNYNKTLSAYFESGKAIEKNELRNFLQEKLPAYMIPDYFVQLESIPLNSSGKVNRKALPEISEKDIIRKAFVLPQNETESKILKIWQEVLTMQEISITDNFFDVGGNSFLIVRLFNKIRSTIDESLKITDLFNHHSIKTQAAYLSKRNEGTEKQVQVTEIEF